jgi:hypothetical protein
VRLGALGEKRMRTSCRRRRMLFMTRPETCVLSVLSVLSVPVLQTPFRPRTFSHTRHSRPAGPGNDFLNSFRGG